MHPEPDYPFVSDGCSGYVFMRLLHWWWKRTGQHELARAVTEACERHDKRYHGGGSASDRVIADAILMMEVAQLGKPLLARLMIFAVGFGGHPWLPFPRWRWGYGYKWPSGYLK